MHLNISLSGVGEGKKALTISREEVSLAMRRDLGRIRGHRRPQEQKLGLGES